MTTSPASLTVGVAKPGPFDFTGSLASTNVLLAGCPSQESDPMKLFVDFCADLSLLVTDSGNVAIVVNSNSPDNSFQICVYQKGTGAPVPGTGVTDTMNTNCSVPDGNGVGSTRFDFVATGGTTYEVRTSLAFAGDTSCTDQLTGLPTLCPTASFRGTVVFSTGAIAGASTTPGHKLTGSGVAGNTNFSTPVIQDREVATQFKGGIRGRVGTCSFRGEPGSSTQFFDLEKRVRIEVINVFVNRQPSQNFFVEARDNGNGSPPDKWTPESGPCGSIGGDVTKGGIEYHPARPATN